MTTSTLGFIFTMVVSPFITQLFKKWNLGDKLSTTLNAVIACVIYMGIWYVSTGANMAEFQAWLTAALAAGGISTVGYNVGKTAINSAKTNYDL